MKQVLSAIIFTAVAVVPWFIFDVKPVPEGPILVFGEFFWLLFGLIFGIIISKEKEDSPFNWIRGYIHIFEFLKQFFKFFFL